MSTKLTLERGDITKVAFDAIVNAANSGLWAGGGVCGAIHHAGGPKIGEECAAIRARQGDCPTGEAVITSGGNLPARYVIHAVGPVFRENDPTMPVLLANSYRNALRLAVENELKTVAFPNISTGIFGYPKQEACPVAIGAVRDFVSDNPDALAEVRFVCFDEENFELYRERLS